MGGRAKADPKLLESWEETEENDQVIANQACLIRSWVPEP